MRILSASLLGLFIMGSAFAADDYAKKLVGTWEISKSEEAPKGAKVTFTDKGKINISISFDGKEFKIDGTYTIKDKTIKTKLEFGGKEKEDELTIEELTDTKLVTKDSKGKIDEFKKVGDKK